MLDFFYVINILSLTLTQLLTYIKSMHRFILPQTDEQNKSQNSSAS